MFKVPQDYKRSATLFLAVVPLILVCSASGVSAKAIFAALGMAWGVKKGTTVMDRKELLMLL
jgi:hypothetical protein